MGAAAAEADRTLFVGNLDPKVTEEIIFELFHQAGPVVKVKIPKDRDGRPKQFAFVNFKHEESVPYGLSLLNGIKLFGRPIKIQFRSGSSHAAQDGNPSCSSHGAANTNPSSTPHLALSCSRYDRVPDIAAAAAGFPSMQRSLPLADNLQRQAVMNSALCLQSSFGGKYEQPAFAPPSYQHPPPPHTFLPMQRRPEPAVPRKGRLSVHPYHVGREPRFGERGPEHGRSRRDEHGFDERGHHDGEHHYRSGREELAYEKRHHDDWSHDYDYRRESYRESKWHPSRH